MAETSDLVEKIIKGCNLFVAVVAAGEKLVEVWSVVEPIVEPLLTAAVFSPETFWGEEGAVKTAMRERRTHTAQVKLLSDWYKEIAEPGARSDYTNYLGHKTPEERDALEDAYDRLTAALSANFPQVASHTQETG
jgi:hypothetical protein